MRRSQGPKDLVRKQILKGEIHMKPVLPEGIGEGRTAAKLMISGAGAYVFTPEEGVCKTVDDSGDVKVFEVMLPTTGAADMVHVLTYTGPVPRGQHALSGGVRVGAQRDHHDLQPDGGRCAARLRVGALQRERPQHRGGHDLLPESSAAVQRRRAEAHGRCGRIA